MEMIIPKIDYNSNEPFSELFERNKETVFDRFFDCIRFGLDNDLSSVILFELGETGYFLEADIEDWFDSIECCITYYSILENYEKCIECKKLQNEIEQRTKK